MMHPACMAIPYPPCRWTTTVSWSASAAPWGKEQTHRCACARVLEDAHEAPALGGFEADSRVPTLQSQSHCCFVCHDLAGCALSHTVAPFERARASAWDAAHQLKLAIVQSQAVWVWREGSGWFQPPIVSESPAPRGWHGAAVCDKKVYIFGGNRYAARAQKPRTHLHSTAEVEGCVRRREHLYLMQSLHAQLIHGCGLGFAPMFDLLGFLNHRSRLSAGAADCRWSRSSDAARPTRQVFSDLWALDCETWVWEQLAGPGMASPAPHPPARSACGLTCYQDHLVLFGGKGHDGTTFLGDLWTFSVHAGSWCVPLIDDRVSIL